MNQPTFRAILDTIEDNDPTFTVLNIGQSYNLLNHDHFSALGAAIGENNHLTELKIDVSSINQSDISTFQSLFDGLKQNSSIGKLHIKGRSRNHLGAVGIEILRAYQVNSNQLTHLVIEYFLSLQQNGGDGIAADTLRCCTNLKTIDLYSCNGDTLVPLLAPCSPVWDNILIRSNGFVAV